MSEDGFLRGHQVARVLGVAVPLAIFLVWWSFQGGTAEIVSESEVQGVVISDDGRTCLVQIESGERVHVIKPRDIRQGMTLRMRRTEYDNGDLRFDPVATRKAVGAE
jgi:hypothetical protein